MARRGGGARRCGCEGPRPWCRFRECLRVVSAVNAVVGADELVGVPHILTYQYDGTEDGNDGLDRFYLSADGVAEPVTYRVRNGDVGSVQDGTAHVGIGVRVNSAGTQGSFKGGYFGGDIAEIILYDLLLTDEEREDVEVYLGEKYGIEVSTITAVEETEELPQHYRLSTVYPNPFNPQARFTLELAQPQAVRVSVYDVLGREAVRLHDGPLGPGEHAFMLHGDGLTSGVYLVRVVGERFSAGRRAVLLK